MKLKKVLAGALASALAVSALAVSANAAIYVPIADVTDSSGNVIGTLNEKKQLLDENKNVIGTLAEDCISVVDADGNVLGTCTEQQPGPALTITNGSWLIQLFNEGNEAEGKPPTDWGIDVTQIASFTIYSELVRGTDENLAIDLDLYDVTMDGFGGNFIYSANGGTIGSVADSPVYKEESVDEFGNKVAAVSMYAKYNWLNGNEWWGLPEEGDTPEGAVEGAEPHNQGTVDYGKKLQMEYIRRFAYSLTYDVAHDTSDEDIIWPAGATCYQVGLQEWGKDFALNLKIRAFVCKDIDGNIMIAFDGLGNQVDEAGLNAIIEDLSQPYVPAEGSSEETEETEASTEAPSNDNNNDAAAETTAATTAAPASSSSSNSNVGIIIAIIAVVVVVIVVVVIVVIKKKKSN